MKTIRLGTRGSLLATAQANLIAELLGHYRPEYNYELIKITTTGDSDIQSPLPEIGGTGVFTKKIERELLNGTIDMAIHSAKDLPSVMTDGLIIGAVPKRADANDVWLSRNGQKLAEIESGSVVGTGSPRRQAMLLNYRPDLKVKDIRGNIQTRLRKLKDSEYDALIMAHAGLVRSGLADNITEILTDDIFLPAPGQGALAAQIRSDDIRIADLVKPIDDSDSHRCLDTERRLLYKLNAGCSAAVGGLAEIKNGELTLQAAVLDKSGSKRIRSSGKSISEKDDLKLVDYVVNDLFSQGAKELIEQ
jgi:hydroxymethylbilane synthase